MILVTGATGTNGKELVRQLAAKGARVRALARNRDKATAELGGPNVEIVEGDFNRPETLEGALAGGVEHVFLVTSPGPQMAEQEGNMIDACTRAGVRHVVKLSAMGAGVNSPITLGRVHGESEKRLEDSGLAFTHLRPNAFMQNTLGFAPTIHAQGVFYAPAGDGHVSLVDVRDIAAVAAVALTEPGHEGQTYEITGPEALSYYDVAEILSETLGRKVTYVDVPPEAAKAGMIGSGMSEWMADAISELFGVWRAGHGSKVTDVVRQVGKTEPHTFVEFARDHAQVFAA